MEMGFDSSQDLIISIYYLFFFSGARGSINTKARGHETITLTEKGNGSEYRLKERISLLSPSSVYRATSSAGSPPSLTHKSHRASAT